jgi:hypothetical protein
MMKISCQQDKVVNISVNMALSEPVRKKSDRVDVGRYRFKGLKRLRDEIRPWNDFDQ